MDRCVSAVCFKFLILFCVLSDLSTLCVHIPVSTKMCQFFELAATLRLSWQICDNIHKVLLKQQRRWERVSCQRPALPLAQLLLTCCSWLHCGVVPRARILRNNTASTSVDGPLYQPSPLADHGYQSLFN